MKRLSPFSIGIYLSMILCVIGIITLNYMALPSGDEIGTADSAINFVLHGEWWSAVWIYTYHPLHNFILVPWLYIFGVSHVSVCALDIVIALIATIVGLKALKDRKLLNNPLLAVAFVLLIWGFIPYYNGRIDNLMMLFTIGMADYIIPSSELRRHEYRMLAFYTFMLTMTGIYTLPVMFLLCLCLVAFYWKNKTMRAILIKKSWIVFLSCLIAFILVCSFYLFNQRLLRFLQTYIRFNSNFNKGMANMRRHFSTSEMIINGYKNIWPILFSLLGILYGGIKKNWNLFSLSVFVLLIPVTLSLVGHYVSYYYWLFSVSSIVILYYVLVTMGKKTAIVIIAFFSLCYYGYPIIRSFASSPSKPEKTAELKGFLIKNKQYLKDSIFVHFEAQIDAPLYYLLQEYPVKISGKVRFLENYVDPKIVFKKTMESKISDSHTREVCMDIFYKIENTVEPPLDKGLIIISDVPRYKQLTERLNSMKMPFECVSTYKNYKMIRFGY